MDRQIMILLDARELMELERILMDREVEEALRFVDKIKKKVERAQQGH